MRRGLPDLRRPGPGRGVAPPQGKAKPFPRPPGQRDEEAAAAAAHLESDGFPREGLHEDLHGEAGTCGGEAGRGRRRRGHACGRGAKTQPRPARGMAAPRKSAAPARTGFPPAPEEGRAARRDYGSRRAPPSPAALGHAGSRSPGRGVPWEW